MELNIQKPLRKYESVIIMHPDASEADQKALFKKNSDIIKKSKGSVGSVDTWGKRKLANTIKRLRVGVYFHSLFEADAACVAELERTMKINDKVLRFLHSRLDDSKELNKHLEEFRESLAASVAKEKEREAKLQARKSAPGGPRRGPKPERD